MTRGRASIIDAARADARIAEALAPVSKALTFDDDERLSIVADARGTKTMAYDATDRLIRVSGTGEYASMTFTYSGDQLTAVTVT